MQDAVPTQPTFLTLSGISKRYGLYLYTKASRSLYSYLGDPVYHRKRLVSLLGL